MCVTKYDSPGSIIECIHMSIWQDERQFECRNGETKWINAYGDSKQNHIPSYLLSERDKPS